jgi:hypothetical protein
MKRPPSLRFGTAANGIWLKPAMPSIAEAL